MTRSTLPRKSFVIDESLYVQSIHTASEAFVPFTTYTRRAIKLLGFASSHGFNTSDTRLLAPDGSAIPIPRLKSPKSEPEVPVRVDIRMPEEEIAWLAETAQAASVSESERVQRALRFMNFIAASGALPRPTFQHLDQMTTTILF